MSTISQRHHTKHHSTFISKGHQDESKGWRNHQTVPIDHEKKAKSNANNVFGMENSFGSPVFLMVLLGIGTLIYFYWR
jgi:hypothetical protein